MSRDDSQRESIVTATRPFDRHVMAVWVIAMIIATGAFLYLVHEGRDIYLVSGVLAIPFAVIGAMLLLKIRSIASAILLIIVLSALVALSASYIEIGVVMALILGSIGSACLVAAFARRMFYGCMSSFRLLNVKPKKSTTDKLVGFLFDIPVGLDTRNVSISPAERNRIRPLRETLSAISFTIPAAAVVWILFLVDPAAISGNSDSFPMITFVTAMYIPALILPFSVFRSTGAGASSGGASFHLSDGLSSTVFRLSVPVFAALVFMAAYRYGDPCFADAIRSILISMVTVTTVTLATSAIYYALMERGVFEDIRKKWDMFVPVPLLMGLDGPGEGPEELFGTPVRDETDTGRVEPPPVFRKRFSIRPTGWYSCDPGSSSPRLWV